MTAKSTASRPTPASASSAVTSRRHLWRPCSAISVSTMCRRSRRTMRGAGLVEGRIGLQLADGLILRRSRVMNDYRIELIGFTDAMVPRLKALGLISEIISWKLGCSSRPARKGPSILASLLDRHSLIGVTDRTAAA